MADTQKNLCPSGGPLSNIDLITVEETTVTEISKNQNDEKEKKDEKAEATFKNFIRVLLYAKLLDWVLMGICLFASIGAGMVIPLMNIVFGQLVGDFANYFTEGTSVTKEEFKDAINKNTLYILYLFIGKFVLSYISLLCVRISGLRISASLRLTYLRALFAQSVGVIDTISPGKVSTRITTSSNTIQTAISQQLAMLFQMVTFTVALYVIAFIYDWILTFVASASIPFIMLAYGGSLPFYLKIHKQTEKELEDASALAFEVFGSIRIVVAFGAEKRLATQHSEMLAKAKKTELRGAPIMGLMFSPSFFAMYGTFGLTFWFGIRQYSRGNIDNINTIVIVLFSVMTATMSIGRLASPILAMSKAASASTELFETIDAEVPDNSGIKGPEVSVDADITFNDVSFVYPSRRDVQVLDHMSVRFETGKVTAIVGPSGSGKTTIVGLLERWYGLSDNEVLSPRDSVDDQGNSQEDSTQGNAKKITTHTGGFIKIGGVEISSIDLFWWRAQIGLVQQEPFLFNDTIFTNVAYGLCGTELQDASKEEKLSRVKEACKEAFADEFITKLPLGYDTVVGESGIKLSGGQRQRLAIARSIIKDPAILILDEATSAIDVRTERIVQEALDRVSKNRTTIVIAHRLSTIKRADKIVVLRKGKVEEEGTHEELLTDENGIYYNLVHSQELVAGHDDEDDIILDAKRTNSISKTGEEMNETVPDKINPREEDAEYKRQGVIFSFGRLLYEQRHHSGLYALTLLGSLGGGAAFPLQAYFFAKIIEVFTFTGDKLVSRGNFWSGMFGVKAVVVAIAYFFLGWSSHIISQVVSTFYRQEYMENMLRKRIEFFDAEGNSAGTLTSRLSTDPDQLQKLMSTEMSMGLIAIFNLIGSVIISFVFGWKLSLVGLFSILPIILVAGYIRFKLEMQFEEMNAKVFANSSQFASEAVGAFRTVTSLIMEDLICSRYARLLDGHVSTAFSKAKYSTIIFAASDSIELGCMALAFWYGGQLLANKEYDIVSFFIIYMAVVQGSQAAGQWFSIAPNMAEATGAANRILSLRPPKPDPSTSCKHPQHVADSVGIEFRNVYFTYPSRTTPVLTGLNLKIEPGQFAALVGPSGCGKSTVISLLERFYDPISGTILASGTDIAALQMKEYRSALALVAQEPTLYEGSIRENVALSVEADEATDAAIERACRDAQIHEFVASLPEGYATRLGPRGVSLSGGQKQRIALARALLRRPRVLLLDEATSSLDSESEKLVQGAIERAAGEGGRTVIAVAHRLATIQKADIIFVMGSGRVLEKGDHQTLLRMKGIYYQMCQAQALDR
ncbi:leptomycin B resistance protein pmd1 [Patellaria atrata CBS 101060]|uniref:Leptomycin B resistance protein pmd1 n=1 Tax=Patellaria atrata CBS 101060 TaxID=1346257 RepID=A0A9P4S5K7_9PEZI|nr:leptomycin B resistance protein pmd1 [Patellaria atrata CBS 101060]